MDGGPEPANQEPDRFLLQAGSVDQDVELRKLSAGSLSAELILAYIDFRIVLHDDNAEVALAEGSVDDNQDLGQYLNMLRG